MVKNFNTQAQHTKTPAQKPTNSSNNATTTAQSTAITSKATNCSSKHSSTTTQVSTKNNKNSSPTPVPTQPSEPPQPIQSLMSLSPAPNSSTTPYKDALQKPRLPAIKLRINNSSDSQFYSNPAHLSNEIKRCKNEAHKQIKLAKIENNIITIATDDQTAHQQLRSAWPSNAFGAGCVILERKALPLTAYIQGVHLDIDLENDTETIDQLQKQGITSVKRVINKKNNKPLTLVSATFSNEDSFKKAIINKVNIYLTKHTIEPIVKIQQCFNCQKIGHGSSKCQSPTRCMICSGNHNHLNCPSNQPRCANCQGYHAACSRSCPYLKEAQLKATQALIQQYTTPFQPQLIQPPSIPNTNQIPNTSTSPTTQAYIKKAIDNELKNIIIPLTSKICETFALILLNQTDTTESSQLQKHLKSIKEIVETNLKTQFNTEQVYNKILKDATQSLPIANQVRQQ